LNNNKKGDPGMLEEDVELAKMRLYVDPVQSFSLPPYRLNLPQLKIANLEQDQYTGLTDLLEAELEYFSKCREILEELKDGWPSG
jgi:endophilin-A